MFFLLEFAKLQRTFAEQPPGKAAKPASPIKGYGLAV
jgi:hypothetical protein